MRELHPALGRLLSHGFQVGLLESGKIRDVSAAFGRNKGRCCPIEPQQLAEVLLHPDCRPHDADEARVAAGPPRLELQVAHDEMDDERGPYLPLDGIRVCAVEALELKRLLELLEEDLDRPPAFVEVGDRAGGPGEVVRHEDHLPGLPADLDDGFHAPELFRVLQARVPVGQDDALVRDDALAKLCLRRGANHPALHRPPFAGDEYDAAPVKFAEEVEAVVAPVADDDVAGPEVRAHGRGLLRLVVACRVDGHEVGQHVRDVRAHVQFCRGLPVDVLRPVDAAERKRNQRRVDRVDVPRLEAGERSPVAQAAESRRAPVEPVAERPIEVLRDLRVSVPVRIGERVALRRADAADARKFRLVDLRDVDELVEAERMQELSEHQRVQLCGIGELACLDLLASSEFFNQMPRKTLDNLGENGYHSPRCLCCLFHSTAHYRTGNGSKATLLFRGTTRRRTQRPAARHRFSHPSQVSMGC